MPSYDYKCKECEHTFEEQLTISDRENPTKEPCPKCGAEGTIYQTFGATAIVDPVSIGRRKPDQGFNDMLKKIHEGMPGSTLDKSRYY